MDRTFDHVPIQTLAFGSCHKTSHVRRTNPSSSSHHWNNLDSSDIGQNHNRSRDNIWYSIAHINPDAFLWLGDSVYSPNSKGVASIESLHNEYEMMLHDPDIGYKHFLLHMRSKTNCSRFVHGTWDDHDYGGNDYGKEMNQKGQRKKLFLDFLDASTALATASSCPIPEEIRPERQGVYSTTTYRFSSPNDIHTSVMIIALDTRWGRDLHHVPSLGGNVYFPKLGSVLASFTRWMTAAMYLVPPYTGPTNTGTHETYHRRMLDEEQWIWLEKQLSIPTSTHAHDLPNVVVILSSVQVLTTNPLFESWGHFPEEKLRLLRLVNQYSTKRRERSLGRNNESLALLFLSGDVHHGEILQGVQVQDENQARLLEVTSSGMTHSISGAFHGTILNAAIDLFSSHRFKRKGYYLHRNFGSIQIDWWNKANQEQQHRLRVNVHNHLGDIMLSTDWHPFSFYTCNMTDKELYDIAYSCLNGHVVKRIIKGYDIVFRNPCIYMILGLLFIFRFGWRRRTRQTGDLHNIPCNKIKSI